MIQSLNENLSGICIGDYVETYSEYGNSQGTVCKIIQPDPPKVRLVNGDSGRVVRIIRSENIILQRIG